jgi:hypothetical protein
LQAAIVEQQHVVLRRLAANRAEAVSYRRLLHNPAVSVEAELDLQAHEQGLATYEGHVLALTDSTALDLSRQARRLQGQAIGPLSHSAQGVGRWLHVTLCLAAEADAPRPVLGVSSLLHWHRPAERLNKHQRAYQKLPLEQKESVKWWRAAEQTRQRLPQAQRVTLVGDREADIYAVLAPLPAQHIDFVVRCRADRHLPQEASGLLAHLAAQPEQGRYTLTVSRRQATAPHPTRTATLAVRYAPVVLARPKQLRAAEAPPTLAVWAVAVTEVDPPAGEPPLQWHLLTSHVVDSPQAARQVVGYYARRWWIEQLFRVFKQQGLRLEETQLDDPEAIMRLVALALPAAVAVMQLVLGRQTTAPQTVLTAVQQQCLALLVPRLEGQTAALRNPHPPGSQAWVSWAIARLGGWSGYASERPPGMVTMRHGWERFLFFFQGWHSVY